MTPRAAKIDDAAEIASIYDEGIADRVATFETQPRSAEQVARWFDLPNSPSMSRASIAAKAPGA